MKIVVGVDRGSYAFNAAARTLTLSGLPTFTAENLALITNQTDGIIIYNFADPTKGATVAGAVITLEYDTTSMDNNDKIQIIMNLRDDMHSPHNAEYTSPTDFTATYTSNVTITLSGLPITITDSSQIEYIKYIPTGGSLAKYLVNGVDGVTITHSSNVLTVNGAGTPFASGDVYEVGIAGQRKAYDPTLDVQKTMEQSPVWSRYTDVEAIISAAQTLTTSFADLGPEIDFRGFDSGYLFLKCTVQASTGIQLKMLGKHTSAGSEEYALPIESGTESIINVTPEILQFPDGANWLYAIPLKLNNAMPFVQFQVKMTVDGGTDGTIDTAYVTKGY